MLTFIKQLIHEGKSKQEAIYTRRPYAPTPCCHDGARRLVRVCAYGDRDRNGSRGAKAARDCCHRGLISATLLTLFVLPALYARSAEDKTLAQGVEEHE